MAALDIDTVLGWRGRTVRDVDGEKIGTLGDVYLDQDDTPAWAGVQTGLFGRHESFIPLRDAREEGDDLVVPYPGDQVKGAPSVDPDVALSDEEEERLFAHYGGAGLAASAAGGESGVGEAGERPAEGRSAAEGGSGGDGAEVVRSEEEVRLGDVQRRPTERVKLRKVRVTEQVQKTVPVRKEVVQVETDPPPPGRIEDVQDAGEARPPDEPASA